MARRRGGVAMAERMRCLGPLCSAGGLAVGVAAAGAVGQGLASVGAGAFFLLANLLTDSTDAPAVLGLVCGLLGAFLGYGLAAACEAGRVLLMSDSWSRDLMMPLRVPLFFVFVTIFHFAEFAFTAVHHPRDVEFRAFLLTPVPMGGYSIAMVAALAEFWSEEALLRHFGSPLPSSLSAALLLLGALLALSGWLLRTAALFTAQSNFTHLVAWQKSPTHSLVRHGVYRLCRHPGYLGWFLWSISTQLVLGNSFCFFAYAAVSWRFFAGRIPGEEAMLVGFFGEEYIQYAEQVPCGIPFISSLP